MLLSHPIRTLLQNILLIPPTFIDPPMRASPLLVACLLLVGCNDDLVRARTPAGATVVSGGNQAGVVGSTLPIPIAVRVADGDGRPVSGVIVTWEPAEHSGTVATRSTTTDAGGVTSTSWTLGTLPGDQEVSVQAGNLGPLTVKAVAAPGKTAVVDVLGVADSMTAIGDTMRLRANARDPFGNLTTGKASWTSSDPSVVLVDSTGAVRASGKGSASIRAHVDGITGERLIRVTATAVTGAAGANGGSIANPDGATLSVSAGTPVDLRVSRLEGPWPDQVLERPAFGFEITPQTSAAATFGAFQTSFGSRSLIGYNTTSEPREVTLEFAVGHTIASVEGLFIQVEVEEPVVGSAFSAIPQTTGSALVEKFTYYITEIVPNARKDGVIAKFTAHIHCCPAIRLRRGMCRPVSLTNTGTEPGWRHTRCSGDLHPRIAP